MNMTPNELDKYHEFYKRNTGYVSEALQEKIRTTRILIAGCGVGGPVAEACVRLGFVNFILADSDTVEVHNLNRQCYVYDDIGKLKVDGLARRLKAINPNISVTTYPEGVTEGNVREMVAQSDFVFDTVDFLELLIIAKLNGYKIEQIDIEDWKDVPGGTFSGSIGHSIQFFRDQIRIFINRILGVYTR
jgi:tRNA A37 threonylcarbamoyladenosine dehydratase